VSRPSSFKIPARDALEGLAIIWRIMDFPVVPIHQLDVY
jgi:hypothetical protein